jgi:hypothetical protein
MSYSVDVSSVGGAAQIVLPALANTYYIISRISYSYNANVTIGAGNVQVSLGSTDVLDIDVKSSQDNFIFNIMTNVNEAATINLAAIALLKGKLSIAYDTYTL